MKVHSQSGLTLLELLVVLVIFGILMAIAFPTFLNLLRQTRLNSAIFQLSQSWKQTRYDAMGSGSTPDTVCMKDSHPIQYAKLVGRDCKTITTWQTLPKGVTLDLNNSTLYSVTDDQGQKIYRVAWADTKGGFGGSAGRLGRITLTNASRQYKCLFLYSVDGSWNIRQESECEK